MRINEVAYEREIDETSPVSVDALMGMNSKRVTKKFRNYQKFLEWSASPDADNYTIRNVYNTESKGYSKDSPAIGVAESKLRSIIQKFVNEQVGLINEKAHVAKQRKA
jgi:hypothetical protein